MGISDHSSDAGDGGRLCSSGCSWGCHAPRLGFRVYSPFWRFPNISCIFTRV